MTLFVWLALDTLQLISHITTNEDTLKNTEEL